MKSKLVNNFVKHLEEIGVKKQTLIKRLFDENHITMEEAILLMNNNEIFINIEKAEMSSGAKLAGGSIILESEKRRI
jgi:hypothetical protein